MKKQELLHIARLMYNLQEYCIYEGDKSEEIPCEKCPAELNDLCKLFVPTRGIPRLWGITKADIERLENEANLEKGIAAIDELAESPEGKVI
ncbi:MAG: hypothetical protein IJI45_11435 [Anaerolineaceae bacterium]|nr:hypothetical protein [Anaerolineaceae bacterium]